MKIYIHLILVFLLSSIYRIEVSAQQLDFELRYDDATSMYEVYATADSSNERYFVGGGSQLSLVLPQDLEDAALQINTVAGGLWTDNSQIYKPESDHIHDFHGIATNGAMVNFKKGEPVLLFTFEIPCETCRGDLRLFDNKVDPTSDSIGMDHADFKNFFANVFDPLNNNWTRNQLTINTDCAYAPTVSPQILTIEQNHSGTICMPIIDPNIGDSFQAQLYDAANANVKGSSELTVSGNELCLTYAPFEDYVGTEEVHIEVCDQTGLCNTAIVRVIVTSGIIYSSVSGYADGCKNIIDWTIYSPSDFTYFELQRSLDGQQFQMLDQFESSNQSTNLVSQFVDKETMNDYHYRLKLKFKDSREEYSQVLFIKADCDEKSDIDEETDGDLTLYPNPVVQSNPILNVKLFADTEEQNLIISDVAGRTLRRVNLGVELGWNLIRLDVSELAVGNYFLMVEGKNKLVKSFTKMDEQF